MSTNIVSIHSAGSSGSPFDAIRQTDEDGNECWFARQLMQLLGYEKWQKFTGAIEAAKENVEACEGKTSSHFLPLEVKSNGRPALDYQLSRLACYHIALSCDSRGKSMVKAAKHYFVVKTREAETIIPGITEDIRKLEIENRNLELKLQVLQAQASAMAAATSLAIVAPAIAEAIALPGVTIVEKVEHVDRTVIVDNSGRVVSQLDGIGITAIQKQFGFSSTKAAWAWLESIGYGKNSGHWEEEMTAHKTPKLPRSSMAELRSQFAKRKGDRQKLIGE